MSHYALSCAWLHWRRHRIGLCILLVCFIEASFLANTAAAGNTNSAGGLAVPLVFGLLYLMAVFTYTEADILSGRSGYPSYLLLLPVRTRDLVLWPMLMGTAAVATGWICLAYLVIRPLGIPVSIVWPAFLFGAIQTSVQALFWSSVQLPYLRMALVVLALPVLITIGLLRQPFGISEGVLVGIYLAVIAGSYLLALRGLSLVRMGDDSSGPVTLPFTLPAMRKGEVDRPFGSPVRALFWADWRQSGRLLPIVTAGMLFFFSVPLLFIHDQSPIAIPGTEDNFSIEAHSLLINVWLRTIAPCVLLPIMFAYILGSGARRTDVKRSDGTLRTFLATSPITSASFVGLKLGVAAVRAVAALAVIVLFLIAWSVVSARRGLEEAPLYSFVLESNWVSALPKAIAAVGIFLVIVWRNQVVSLFADLSGRRWFTLGYQAAAYGLLLAAFFVFVNWPNHLDEYQENPFLSALVLYAAYGGVLLKIGWTVWAARRLIRLRLMSAASLAKILAAWLAATVAVTYVLATCGLEHWKVMAFFGEPSKIFPLHNIAIIAIMFVPLARLLSAPLTLEWNRRR